jgi:hypothetical protein
MHNLGVPEAQDAVGSLSGDMIDLYLAFCLCWIVGFLNH